MVRTYKKKTKRGKATVDQYRAAAREVELGASVREAARSHELCHVSLGRYIKKTAYLTVDEALSVKPGYSHHHQVFSEEEEISLSDYLLKSADMHFGLSTIEVRMLAYQCAKKFNIAMPTSWNINQYAGKDWFLSFMKRNNHLSIRIAENTSLARAIGFNRPAVNRFYDNLANALSRYTFRPESIYNMDETGVTTVPKANRVVAKKGSRSVGSVVSAERGVLVTVACAINAIGNAVPPMLIFPRKNYRDHFIIGAPPGSIGVANGSGWMKEEDFLTYIQHFAGHANPSATRPVLLILDNHISHLYVPAIDFCRENNITLLSIPPHSSHKLQPLDRVVYGPFKAYVNNLCHAWMREHPGQAMTIYDVPGIVGNALPQATTQKNIVAAFQCTGIYPFNRDIFPEAEFAPSEVTDRPIPMENPDYDLYPANIPTAQSPSRAGPSTAPPHARISTSTAPPPARTSASTAPPPARTSISTAPPPARTSTSTAPPPARTSASTAPPPAARTSASTAPPPAKTSAFTAQPPARTSASTAPPPARISTSTTPPPARTIASTAPPPARTSAFTAPPPARTSASTAPPLARISTSTTPPPARTIASTAPPPARTSAFTAPPPARTSASTAPPPARISTSTTPPPARTIASTAPPPARISTSTAPPPARTSASTAPPPARTSASTAPPSARISTSTAPPPARTSASTAPPLAKTITSTAPPPARTSASTAPPPARISTSTAPPPAARTRASIALSHVNTSKSVAPPPAKTITYTAPPLAARTRACIALSHVNTSKSAAPPPARTSTALPPPKTSTSNTPPPEKARATTAPAPANTSTTTAPPPNKASTTTTASPPARSSTTTASSPPKTRASFSPETVIPFPRAQRKESARPNIRKRKSEVLTDTPVKLQLEARRKNKSRPTPAAASKNKAKANVPKRLFQGKGKGGGQHAPRRRQRLPSSSSSSDGDENICLICCESFESSIPGETWIQCWNCKFWSHEACTPSGSQTVRYICDNCDSD